MDALNSNQRRHLHRHVAHKQASLRHGRRKTTLSSIHSDAMSNIAAQGYPEDLVVSVALGADMFDCVWPTRTAVSTTSPLAPRIVPENQTQELTAPQRFGNGITSTGILNLRHASFANDFRPIDPTCACLVCRSQDVLDDAGAPGLGVSRAYIHHVAAKETAGAHLLSIHNVHYQLALMGRVRAAIVEDRFPAFLRVFFRDLYGALDAVPGWVVGALRGVGVDLLEDMDGEKSASMPM